MSKLYLFHEHATKDELIHNRGYLAILDEIVTNAKITFKLDSNHTIVLSIDSELGHDVIQAITGKVIIKAQTITGEYEYFETTGDDLLLDDSFELVGRQLTQSWMNKMFIVDAKPRNYQAGNMMRHLKESTEEYKQRRSFALDLEVDGNIDTVASCNAWHTTFNNFMSTLQTLYSAEVRRKGFTVSLLRYVGSESPVYSVEYGVNLINQTRSREFDVIYGILPKGYDQLYADIVYSTKIKQGITKEITYPVRVREEGASSEDDEEGYFYFDTEIEAKKKLQDLAREDFEQNKLDEIVITYDIDYLDLAKVEESEEMDPTHLEVGDVVTTRILKLNQEIATRVHELEYDILTNEITTVTLSNAQVGSLKVPTINSVNQDVLNKPSVEDVTSITKLESTNILNAGLTNSYVVVRKNEVLVMDHPSIEDAVNVWRWNRNGLMHSNTGYYGVYTMGMRYDGVIFADLLRAGIIRNLSGTLEINLEGNGVQFNQAGGKKAIDVIGSVIKFYDWSGEGEEVGQIYSTRIGGQEDKLGMAIGNSKGRCFSIVYEKNNTYYAYVRFDKDNVDGHTTCPITIFEVVDYQASELWFKYGINSLYTASSNDFVAKVKANFHLQDTDTKKSRFINNKESTVFKTDQGKNYFDVGVNYFTFWHNGRAYLYKASTEEKIICQINMSVLGDLTVSGTKNCVQKTESYGERLFYSVEDAESYLTDRSMELMKVEITEAGTFEKKIYLDEVYKECVNLKIDYTVEIIKQGWGDYRIKEQTKDYFIVEASREDFTFKYVVTAKRGGFEHCRLELFKKR